MALIKESDLRRYSKKSEYTVESASDVGDPQSFDIFLSHSLLDKDIIIGLKKYLEESHLSIYIDWINDKQLDRSSVNEDTAETLRKRMKQCKSLLFATSLNSSVSKWMPWECGYFDALNGKVAILPIVPIEQGDINSFKGQEYLGLYSYIDNSDSSIRVNGKDSGSCSLKEWLNGNSSTN